MLCCTGHVAQHITLSGDGGGDCEHEGSAGQSCEQVMVTRDGGRTYAVVKKIKDGTSGNFNGYGDLGSWVPPRNDAAPTPGVFEAIVGCNDCFQTGGGSLTWVPRNIRAPPLIPLHFHSPCTPWVGTVSVVCNGGPSVLSDY